MARFRYQHKIESRAVDKLARFDLAGWLAEIATEGWIAFEVQTTSRRGKIVYITFLRKEIGVF